MSSENIYKKLRDLRPAYKDLNIRRMAVYGSRARGTAGPDSDLDLLIEFIETPGFIGFMETKDRLEKELGVHVDLTTFQAAQRKAHMNHILEEARDV